MKKFILFALLLTPFLFSQVEVSTRLQRVLKDSKSTELVKGFIYLKDQVDIEALDARLYKENANLQQRAFTVITMLQEKAQKTQSGLLSFLEQQKAGQKVSSYQGYWIANMIQIEAKPEVYRQLMNSMELAQMDLDAELMYDKPVRIERNTGQIETVESGIKIINADKLWRLGITGQGRIVMSIDTGVDGTHPALNFKWRGNHVPASQAWFDPAGTTTPTDCDGHGTHTMGTMCGYQSSTGDTVGIAINAEWIAAKGICTSPATSNCVAAFQWAMSPDGNPATISDMPDVISNSWYDPDVTDECSGIYKATLDAVEAVGIAVCFSAGNNGPGASTCTKPKNINTDEVNVFSVGAIDGALWLAGNTNPIASFSSRGPSTCGGTGSLLIKPEVSAPGVGVRSSYGGGGYSTLDGTSMASPHVAGAIALLKSFQPQYTGKQIKQALYNTARDLGTAGEDNDYGRGLIDVYAAYLTMGTPDSVPPTQITNLSVVNPTSSSLSLSWTAPADTSPSHVTGYNIRRSLSPITDTVAFNNATAVPYNGMPLGSGQTEILTADSLSYATKYYFSIRSRDVWGNWSLLSNNAFGTTLAAPVVFVSKDSLTRILLPQTTIVDSIIIKNNSLTPSTLQYSVELANNTFPGKVSLNVIPMMKPVDEKLNQQKTTVEDIENGQSVKAHGGPDAFGYKWIDSDDPNGPQYVWEDISTTGTLTSTWTSTGTFNAKDEGYTGPYSLGLNFKFYGQVKTNVYVSSNGFVFFTLPSPIANMYTNAAIPTAAIPNDYIAPFWDDLDGSAQGTVHYKQDGSRFIIQFTNWKKYSGTSSLTFQVIINSGGKIMVYYKDMTGTLNSATIGLENAAGTVGLQTAFNANYVHNNMAVKYSAEPDWVAANNVSGSLTMGNSAAVQLTFKSEDFPAGMYSMDLKVKSNDPSRPVVIVPIKMTLNNPTLPITVTAPNGGENWVAASSHNISWVTNGVSNVALKYSTDNGTTWISIISSTPASVGSYSWQVPSTPSTQCKVRVSDATADTTADISNNAFTISTGAITWQQAMVVKDNGNVTNTVTFGMSPTATNGIDASLGEVSLSAVPPAGTFDARFELPVVPVAYSLKDYRRDTLQVASWSLNFQASAGGFPFTFTWNPSTLPAGTFTLKDATTGLLVNIDMKAQSSYTLTNSAVNSLRISYQKQVCSTLSLLPDWNMVSIPVTPANATATAIFPTSSSYVFSYNNGYNVQTSLAPGSGYWVRYANSATATVCGNAVAAGTTIPLLPDWNMIGGFSWNVPTSALTTVPANILNSSFFSYNNGYNVATTLTPGLGFWVRATQNGTLTIPAAAGFVSKNGTDGSEPKIDKDWARISITDNAGKSTVLYSAKANTNLSMFELPPVPPVGIFDARFTSNRNVEAIGSDGKQIVINSATYPIEVRFDGIDALVQDNATKGKFLSEHIKGSGTVRITNPGVNTILVISSDKPTSYELLQNYPNPFNPTTIIKFGLPEKTNAVLTVYNQLGEKIVVLANGELEGGYHSVEWNASNQPSGIYFYELKTEKYSSVKKLMLMK